MTAWGNTEGISGLQGGGAVYFYADPGELVIDLEKQDLYGRRDWNQEFRVVLTGPDRAVVAEAVIPDYDFNGDADHPADRGPLMTARLAVTVPAAGVYKLLVTVVQDRYGHAVVWGFRTNCPRYLIDPKMGHRDSARRDPIMLNGNESPESIVFLPSDGSFSIDATNLPSISEPLRLYDAEGTEVAASAPTNGKCSFTISADTGSRTGPWRLSIPQRKGHFEIDGLTRWESEATPAYWTNRTEAFFPLHAHRWLIGPPRILDFRQPGERGWAEFTIRNDSADDRTIQLSIEFPEDADSWQVQLPVSEVNLTRGESKTVFIGYEAPEGMIGESYRFIFRATVPADGFTAYSSATVTLGTSPVAEPLSMPIALKPYAHEGIQFGRNATANDTSEFYFDGNNQPYFVADSGIGRKQNGEWVISRFLNNVTDLPAGWRSGIFRTPFSRIGINQSNHLQLVVTINGQPAYLYSADGGRNLSGTLFPIGNLGHYEIETWKGHNVSPHPRPVLRYVSRGSEPRDPSVRWGIDHDLELYLPRLNNDRVELGDPILISRHCIGTSAHSGIPGGLVSDGDKVHIVWGETTAPEEQAPGVPTKVATYDRKTGILSDPVLVGYAPPANDVHNTPSILVDSKGFLHVLIGAHNDSFQYTQSLQAHRVTEGWTLPEFVAPDREQTYIGAVFDSRDTLHLVYRIWRRGEDFPGLYDTALYHQKKPVNGNWSEARLLVSPPLPHYSIYYQRLTIDRNDRLYLSYDYWSTWSAYNDEMPGGLRTGSGFGRTLIESADSGETWHLAPVSIIHDAPFEFENRNTVYTQDFSHLVVSNPSVSKAWVDGVTVPHWRASVGDAPATFYNVTHGSNPNSGLQVWDMRDGTNRRALGMLTDIHNPHAQLAFGMLNSTGTAINEVTVEFTQAQWYGGTGAAIDEMTFSYRPNHDSPAEGPWLELPELNLDGFVSGPGGLAEPLFTQKGATLTDLAWQPGQELWIRWIDTCAPGGNAGAGFASMRVFLPENMASDGFEQWQAMHYSAEELANDSISGPTADPGGFGIPNILRYLLSLDPRQPETSDLPVATLGSNNELIISFSRIADATDVEAIVETSTDLLVWQTVPFEQIQILPSDSGLETVTVRKTLTHAERQFFRIRANRK